MRALLERLKGRHPVRYQFLFFEAMGGIVTAVDFAIFALCRYLLFTSYLDTPFSIWIFSYPVDKGGLCAFLAFSISFAVAKVLSFCLQRWVTFHADNSLAASATMFAVMVLFVLLVNTYLPLLTLGFLTRWFGAGWAGSIAKGINMVASIFIEFPIDKFVIMRRKKTEI